MSIFDHWVLYPTMSSKKRVTDIPAWRVSRPEPAAEEGSRAQRAMARAAKKPRTPARAPREEKREELEFKEERARAPTRAEKAAAKAAAIERERAKEQKAAAMKEMMKAVTAAAEEKAAEAERVGPGISEAEVEELARQAAEEEAGLREAELLEEIGAAVEGSPQRPRFVRVRRPIEVSDTDDDSDDVPLVAIQQQARRKGPKKRKRAAAAAPDEARKSRGPSKMAIGHPRMFTIDESRQILQDAGAHRVSMKALRSTSDNRDQWDEPATTVNMVADEILSLVAKAVANVAIGYDRGNNRITFTDDMGVDVFKELDEKLPVQPYRDNKSTLAHLKFSKFKRMFASAVRMAVRAKFNVARTVMFEDNAFVLMMTIFMRLLMNRMRGAVMMATHAKRLIVKPEDLKMQHAACRGYRRLGGVMDRNNSSSLDTPREADGDLGPHHDHGEHQRLDRLLPRKTGEKAIRRLMQRLEAEDVLISRRRGERRGRQAARLEERLEELGDGDESGENTE